MIYFVTEGIKNLEHSLLQRLPTCRHISGLVPQRSLLQLPAAVPLVWRDDGARGLPHLGHTNGSQVGWLGWLGWVGVVLLLDALLGIRHI